MTAALEWISFGIAGLGTFFFITGSVGLMRLPDVYSRLHALSKADNTGVGLLALATMLRADSWQVAFKAGLVWVLIVIASACLCSLLVRVVPDEGLPPPEGNDS